ncbi:MAG: sulfur carrier protein ThiS adenylyltransferase ThiF [Spirochaetales bacterium]|nr:MAG: sulfur carrier protein ThiS adenylyltransferase ThiF [Spirochaetales bacterium]
MAKIEGRDAIRAALAKKRVGIAGAGGLGSNCAAALARAGVGSLVIADFDTVSRDNLDRQYFFLDQVGMAKVDALAANLARIDPGIRIETARIRLDADSAVALYSGCDVIVEAFDEAAAKSMLIEAVLSRLPGVPVVAASGLAGWGASDSIYVRRCGDLVVVGDEDREVSPNLPPVAPRVGVVANFQANEALELLLGPMDGDDR